MFVAECDICHRKHEANKINDAVLDLKHHPECETVTQKMAWNPIIRDSKFD